VPDVDDLYDWELFARRTTPAPPVHGRGGVGAAILAAALWAIDDVVLGEKQRTPVIAEMDAPGADPDARVIVHLVPGMPQRSIAVVREPRRLA